MRPLDALAELRRLNRPVVESGEAVASLGISRVRTSQLLRDLERSGLVVHLRRGLWLLDREIEPFAVAPYLTAPYPAYVSFASALRQHGMIEQIPRQISVASLGRPVLIETPLASYQVHHLAPDVFGGYDGALENGYVATAEKALFDSVYLPASRRRRVYLPEIEFPKDFSTESLFAWTEAIGAGWLQTRVRRELEVLIDEATSAHQHNAGTR